MRGGGEGEGKRERETGEDEGVTVLGHNTGPHNGQLRTPPHHASPGLRSPSFSPRLASMNSPWQRTRGAEMRRAAASSSTSLRGMMGGEQETEEAGLED